MLSEEVKLSENFEKRLLAATARIQYGSAESAAGADDKARAIYDEVTRHGGGKAGAERVAQALGVSPKTIYAAVARARRAPDPSRTLPPDTLERLLAAETATLPPLPATHWQTLQLIVRGTIIDTAWVEHPGELLAHEVADCDLLENPERTALADTCRAFSPGQALAVIDACQRDDLTALPVRDTAPKQPDHDPGDTARTRY